MTCNPIIRDNHYTYGFFLVFKMGRVCMYVCINIYVFLIYSPDFTTYYFVLDISP